MKKYWLFFLVSLFVVVQFNAQGLNKKDAQGRKQGPWEKAYPKSRALEYKGQFKDDKPVGTFYYYYPSNKLKSVVVHDPVTNRSTAIVYHENGTVFAQGIYRNQLKDSVWNYYGPSGRQSLQETYKDNKLHGLTTVFYVPEMAEDKRLMKAKTTMYENGIKNGEVIEYFDDGIVKSKGKYLNGVLDGLFTINHPNGNKMILERYKKGERHGWCSTYDQVGKELGKKYYYYGQLLEGKELEKKLQQMKELGIDPNG